MHLDAIGGTLGLGGVGGVVGGAVGGVGEVWVGAV
jgi:hypothetical protein